MPVLVGQEAPDFELRNQNGEPIRLSSYRGEKNVVLMFYPYSFTGTCTGELYTIRDRMSSFDNADTVTLAVSCDSVFVQRVFADRDGYGFSLLSDFWPHGEVAKAYGVLLEDKGAALRGTFIIDKQGIVRWTVLHGLSEARDADEYEKALASL